MQYTNRFNVPSCIVNNVINDDYDRGDAMISITQLINSPRIVLLQRVNDSKIVADVVDRIPSLLGRALHKVCEQGASPGEIVEERLFTTVNGWKISGAIDLQVPQADGSWAINDYKLTSVYAVQSEKPEWEQQLNCYAYLMRKASGKRVSKLQIVAIMKDWNRKQRELKPHDYPECQLVMVDISVWSDEEQDAFVEARVKLHQDNWKRVDRQEQIDYCTDTERWVRGEKYAVMKKGRKSAVRLFDTRGEADGFITGQGDADLTVDHRPGSAIRCAGDYCQVSRWCKQWIEQSGGGAD